MTARVVPAHYIAGNELNRQPKCWIYLDTEATIEDDERGQIQRWRLAVTAHDHRRGAYDDWREPEWAIHATPLDLWRWVDDRARIGERVVLVAHNLGYDLRISDAFTHLPALGWRLDRIRLDAEQSQARWRRGRRTILMVDSLSWWPVALETLGDELGIHKPALPTSSSSEAEWVDRCVTDVTILRTAWRRLLDWLHTDDIGNWQPTGASQAWSAWRHRFMEHKILVDPDPQLRERERLAAWCGRAEAWRWGKHEHGPYAEWDLAACYLNIMAECDLPIMAINEPWDLELDSIRHFMELGRVLATVEVETDVPLVPAAGPHGILWPVGKFETTVWDPELELLLASDAKVTVRWAWVYRRRPALAQFAEWLRPMITDEFARADPIVARLAKHWSRVIVGRFGVRYSVWDDLGVSPAGAVGLMDVTDLRDDSRWRLLAIGDRTLRESETLEGENAVPSIMGWIMSETRARLWRVLDAAGFENVVSCDTDGLIVTPAGNERLEAAAIDGLRLKGEWSTVEVFGPRQIALGGQLRAPGVPRRARRVGRDTWNGERWQGLGMSLREGAADSVRVQRTSIRLHGVDHRRVHLKRGRTRAYDAGELEAGS